VQGVTSAPALADLIASFMDITRPRSRRSSKLRYRAPPRSRVGALGYRLEVLRLSRQISDAPRRRWTRQREFLLREQLKTIQNELGEATTPIAGNRRAACEIERPDAGGVDTCQEGAGALERMPEAAANIRWRAPI